MSLTSRTALDPKLVEAYSHAYRGGAGMPPVVVFHCDGEYWLADGFHRVAALRLDNDDATIDAEVHQGAMRDAILFACGANQTHGLRRSRADKEHAVKKLLNDDEWTNWSDREIAKRCVVSHTFVRKVRTAGVTGNVASDRSFVTKHGGIAVMDTSNIGKRLSTKSSNDRKDADTEVPEVQAVFEAAPDVSAASEQIGRTAAKKLVIHISVSRLRNVIRDRSGGRVRAELVLREERAKVSHLAWAEDVDVVDEEDAS